VDSSGNAYFLVNYYDSPSPVQYSVYVIKLNPSGSGATVCGTLSRYGAMGDPGLLVKGSDLAVDESGNSYVVGYTSSPTDITTPGAFDTTHNGGTDAFVAKFSSSGTKIFGTYLGGSGNDYGDALDIDESGVIYVAGHTASSNFPTTSGVFDTSFNGGNDLFVAKLNAAGTGLVFSTFIGGSGDDVCSSLDVGAFGGAYLTGSTNSSNFPTTAGAYDTGYNGGTDVFVCMLSPTGTTLSYSTYLGGSSDEEGTAVKTDSGGKVFIAGFTGSGNFPFAGFPYDSSHNGGFDAFVTKLLIADVFVVPFGSLDNGNVDIANVAAVAANGILQVRDVGGVLLGETSFTVPARGVVRSWDIIGNIYNYGKPVSMDVIMDQPLIGDNIKWAGPPYDTVGAGFTCGSAGLAMGREFYFPFSSAGGWANAYCVIANLSADASAVTIYVYDSTGILKTTQSFSIPGLGLVRSWDYIGGIQAIADPALLKIVSSKDVVVEAVRWEENKRGWGFAIFPSSIGAGTHFLIPFGSLDNGNMNIANTSSSLCTVTLSVRSVSGLPAESDTFTIPAKGVVESWDRVGNIYNYGKPVTVEITSTQPIVVDNIKWAGPPYDTVGAGFSCAPLDLMKGRLFYFPFSSFASSTNAYCVIANPTTDTFDGVIGIYDSSGALKKSARFTMGPLGVVRGWDVIGSIQAVADPALVGVVTGGSTVVEAVRWEENRRGWGFAVLPYAK
jgi:hypothetical protein